ncbi:hypothetical protein BDQ94DRAFT_134068 [Aspergillus welwitschiae]|uniref:Uncharacterized protein n=1 Tax=Aspergillus welwitschiae TaxID=1341132 RepID=A0A3F3QIN1_9EURO|nr:hypothetical protein BDQ94DRAFT_134068 [Aspergillus welwitschiae]RDH38526.1 hypothetical protein BDQ94DRAFT_134068 [Aspergillus welwitschiae]
MWEGKEWKSENPQIYFKNGWATSDLDRSKRKTASFQAAKVKRKDERHEGRERKGWI